MYLARRPLSLVVINSPLMAGLGVRRGKAAFSSGRETHTGNFCSSRK